MRHLLKKKIIEKNGQKKLDAIAKFFGSIKEKLSDPATIELKKRN
jgi:hypothetical protein